MREDIFHFIASRYGARLREAGYPVPADNDAIVRAYHNVRLRTVATIARRVSKAAGYAVPDHLASGESAFTFDVTRGH